MEPTRDGDTPGDKQRGGNITFSRPDGRGNVRMTLKLNRSRVEEYRPHADNKYAPTSTLPPEPWHWREVGSEYIPWTTSSDTMVSVSATHKPRPLKAPNVGERQHLELSFPGPRVVKRSSEVTKRRKITHIFPLNIQSSMATLTCYLLERFWCLHRVELCSKFWVIHRVA